jgi:hypothetical protein
MKKFKITLLALSLFGLFVSCESIPFNYYVSETWSKMPGSKHTILLDSVAVDRIGSSSIENEIAGLSVLLFAECGFHSDANAEYAVRIHAREREYETGWQTRRSLVMEVRIYQSGSAAENNLPLATGRISSSGTKTFSSSETISHMLKLAITKSVHALEKAEKKSVKREKFDKSKDSTK